MGNCNMVIIWLSVLCFAFYLPGCCNGREIFVSPLGRNNLNCTTMDDPCLTIQYAIDNIAVPHDVIKIDGSQGNFTIKHRVKFVCMNLTFTSYNGVAWIYRDTETWKFVGYGTLVELEFSKLFKCEIIFTSLNFRDTNLLSSNNYFLSQLLMQITLTVRNCLFEFSDSQPTNFGYWLYYNLILVKSQYSHITLENCTIKANYRIGILYYPVGHGCIEFTSTEVTLRETRIEDARYTVYAIMKQCTDATFKKHFKVKVVNSILRSTGKYPSRTPQFGVAIGKLYKKRIWLSIYMKNSQFENLSVLTNTAAVMDIRGPSAVFIRNCTFTGNIGNRGGALSLQSIVIKIIDSVFNDNKARVITLCAHKDQGGCGGAIFIDGAPGSIIMKIFNTSFINNMATCFGSAVYLGYFNTIVFKQNQFSTKFTSPSDTIWFSYSDNLRLQQVSFEAREASKTDGGLFFARSKSFTFGKKAPYFECPLGSTLNISDSGMDVLGKARGTQVRCHYCSKDAYTLTPSNITGLNETNNNQNRLQPQCQSCIFGAVCHRGIKPKPNFWGYVYKSKAFMIVCPPGYCCQTPNQCIALTSCNKKRTGRLCGKCKHGYFQSVFTNECLDDKMCMVPRFWIVAIIICLLFTLLFIFLQDIFVIIVKMLRMEQMVFLHTLIVKWTTNILHWKRRHFEQQEQLNNTAESGVNVMNTELNEEREDEEVDETNDTDVDERKPESKNKSTASGLIKIVFFFYQIHSVLTVYKSNREIQYFRELKSLILSVFNLNAQVPLRSEFHCPFHGIGSSTKVWIKALFPVNCLMFAVLFYTCVYASSYCFSRSHCIQKYSTKVRPRLFTAILQLILLGYSTLTSSILSLLTCLSLVNGERILYIDGNVPCYQTWQYAILMFIVLWAIPLIYALHKLPSYMRNGELSIRGVYVALLLPLPFAVYTIVKGVRKMSCTIGANTSNDECATSFSRNPPREDTNTMMFQLLNVIEGPFRCRTSSKKEEKLSWEPILLLQRLLLSLSHTFVLEPGIRSLLLLLVIIILAFMNVLYRPFGTVFLNIANGITFIFLCITGIINSIHAFIYEYGSVPKGPLVQLLSMFDYVEVVMVMIFPVIAIGTLAVLAVVKFTVFVGSFIGFIISSCKSIKCSDA